jgi:hypothetical protein
VSKANLPSWFTGFSSSSHAVVNAAGTENALGESSTINSIVVSSKHPNAELFVKTAFIVWEVLEKLAGNGLVIKTPFESFKGAAFWSK